MRDGGAILLVKQIHRLLDSSWSMFVTGHNNLGVLLLEVLNPTEIRTPFFRSYICIYENKQAEWEKGSSFHWLAQNLEKNFSLLTLSYMDVSNPCYSVSSLKFQINGSSTRHLYALNLQKYILERELKYLGYILCLLCRRNCY